MLRIKHFFVPISTHSITTVATTAFRQTPATQASKLNTRIKFHYRNETCWL